MSKMVAADALAQQRSQRAGARSATEMRAFLVSRSRRCVGVTAVQAMARHRLARVPYIGVPRQIIAVRAQRGAAGGVPYAPEPGHADFFQFQANAPQHAAA